MKFHLYNEAGMHLNGRLTYTAGGAIARGDVLKFDTDGNVVKCAAATDAAIGVALDAATAADDLIEVAHCVRQ